MGVCDLIQVSDVGLKWGVGTASVNEVRGCHNNLLHLPVESAILDYTDDLLCSIPPALTGSSDYSVYPIPIDVCMCMYSFAHTCACRCVYMIDQS